MMRFSEMVLQGHPDKLCDRVADAIVARCAEFDAEAYCQVEVSAWRDTVWLSGGLTLPEGLSLDIDDIVAKVAQSTGCRDAEGNLRRYRVTDTLCHMTLDPRSWTRAVNDQAICMGWAGYDESTRRLPPEHFLAHTFREALEADMRRGRLRGQGPDGKLLVLMAEEGADWRLEKVLVTLEQSPETDSMTLASSVEAALCDGYEAVQKRDRRWNADWDSVLCMVNPNGPLIGAGTETDNGQTGRKLAMDYYGPRVGQGGGALSGKHLTHIDRIGSYAAREAAVEALRTGAKSCRILLAYAPNCPEPLELAVEMEGRGRSLRRSDFNHAALCERYRSVLIRPEWACGTHFWDPDTPWNRTGGLR
jgi:S-adenosylmethionine synthetase